MNQRLDGAGKVNHRDEGEGNVKKEIKRKSSSGFSQHQP